MDKYRNKSLPPRAECLATHKYKARVIRQSMLLDDSSIKDEELAKKVVKYETFLSHQMLDKIKDGELQAFHKEMRDYCQRHRSFESGKSQTNEK